MTPDGKKNGLHAFIVPIRDPSTLQVFPGLTIGDLGEKVALNGLDNGLDHKFRLFDPHNWFP